MASRNGLNPKIRGPKGVGYGRALPAAFGFGNGIVPNGSTNNFLSITPLIGKTWPMEGCIELWAVVTSNSRGQREIEIQFNDSSNLRITAYASPYPVLQSVARETGSVWPSGTYNVGTRYHYAFMWDANFFYAWGNALLPNTIVKESSGLTSNINLPIVGAAICGQVDGTLCSTTKLDEVRFYNKKLSLQELVDNDNNGIGNNPATTENLFAWYQFEKFEMLDFSTLQDNSDLRLAIKDVSGNLNHAQVFGMDTDPLSGTYVLKPI